MASDCTPVNVDEAPALLRRGIVRILPVSVVSVRRNGANRNSAPPRSRVSPPRSSRARKACEPSPVQNIQIQNKLLRTPAQYVRSSEITPASGSRMWCSTEHFRIRKCSVYYTTKFIIQGVWKKSLPNKS